MTELVVIVEPYTGPVYRRSGDSIVVIGAGSSTGVTKLLRQDDNMFGRVVQYDDGLAQRDANIAKVRKQLSLAMIRRNKAEVTRLSKQLTYLGQSW